MATSARVALRPHNEAPRATWQGRRGTTNNVDSSSTADNVIALEPQPGRIIRLHWLRDDEDGEALP